MEEQLGGLTLEAKKVIRKGNVTLIMFLGKLTIGDGAAYFRSFIRDLLDRGSKHFLLDFGGVSNLDSAGIGELVAAFTVISDKRGKMKLLHLSRRNFEKLQTVLLTEKIECFESQDEAVDSFKEKQTIL